MKANPPKSINQSAGTSAQSRGRYYERRLAQIAEEERQRRSKSAETRAPKPVKSAQPPRAQNAAPARPPPSWTHPPVVKQITTENKRLDPLQALRLLQQQSGGAPQPARLNPAQEARRATMVEFTRNRRANPPKLIDPLDALLAGRAAAPVSLAVGAMLATDCAKAWCHGISVLATHENRHRSGIAYLRGGALLDLTIQAGLLAGIVRGESLYKVRVSYPQIAAHFWQTIAADYLKRLDTGLDLLKGHLSERILQSLWCKVSVLQPQFGPANFTCTCPDPLPLCKHVIAVLYGTAVLLERDPQLLLAFRGVDSQELVRIAQKKFQSEPTQITLASRRLPVTTITQLIDRELIGTFPSLATGNKTKL